MGYLYWIITFKYHTKICESPFVGFLFLRTCFAAAGIIVPAWQQPRISLSTASWIRLCQTFGFVYLQISAHVYASYVHFMHFGIEKIKKKHFFRQDHHTGRHGFWDADMASFWNYRLYRVFKKSMVSIRLLEAIKSIVWCQLSKKPIKSRKYNPTNLPKSGFCVKIIIQRTREQVWDFSRQMSNFGTAKFSFQLHGLLKRKGHWQQKSWSENDLELLSCHDMSKLPSVENFDVKRFLQ